MRKFDFLSNQLKVVKMEIITDLNATPTILFNLIGNICPATDSKSDCIITVVIDENNQLGKRFKLMKDGDVEKKSSVLLSRGMACQYYVPDHITFQNVLAALSNYSNVAIINAGWIPAPVGEPFIFLSKNKLLSIKKLEEDVINENGFIAFARLKVHAKPSIWQLLDRDEDKFTPTWAAKQTFDEWRESVSKILPSVNNTSMLRAHSSSARVFKQDGTSVGGGNGHVWVKINDANDAARTRVAITARALEHGLAWKKPRFSKSTGLECGSGFATIIDSSVWTIGRLVFVGCPTCSGELTVRPAQFELIKGNEALDTSQSNFSPLKTYLASSKQGVKLRMSKNGKEYSLVVNNLSLETELELEGGAISTVSELMQNFNGKVRCQTPFRSSNSLSAFLAIDHHGDPFIFDSGTNTNHFLSKSSVIWKEDRIREDLIQEVKSRLSVFISNEFINAILDEDVVRTAWDATFYNTSNKCVGVINEYSDLIELSLADYIQFGFHRTFGPIFHKELLDEVTVESHFDEDGLEKFSQAIYNLKKLNIFIEHLKLYKQAKAMDIKIDMFAKRGNLSVSNGISTIALPHRPFLPKSIIEQPIIDKVVADYILHFPEFRDFLALILYARFATDRRQAFLWLHSPSSWGKGFLVAIFMELLLVVEVQSAEIEKAMTGGPVGLSLAETLRAWILFIDEFKKASSDLKLLNTKMSISPKNQLRISVQLYTKLFASAENVLTLVGSGAEEQFDNRFAYLSPSTRQKKLDDRVVFMSEGKVVYLAAMVNFVAEYLNQGVDRLQQLGPVESARISDSYIKKYQNERRLSTVFGNLNDTVDDIVSDLRICLIEYAGWHLKGFLISSSPAIVQGLGMNLLNTLKRTAEVGFVCVGGGIKDNCMAIVISDAVAFIQNYLELSKSPSTGKLYFKADVIAKQLHMRKEAYSGKVRIYQKDQKGLSLIINKRGVVIFLSDPPKENSILDPDNDNFPF